MPVSEMKQAPDTKELEKVEIPAKAKSEEHKDEEDVFQNEIPLDDLEVIPSKYFHTFEE